MEKVKTLIWRTARAANLVLLMAMMIAAAVLQDRIATNGPSEDSAIELQSWMTFFGLLFLHISVTEVYDDSGLLIFKPGIYAKEMEKRAAKPVEEQQVQAAGNDDEGRDARDQSFIYDVFLCGGLRKCVLTSRARQSVKDKKRTRCFAISVLTAITLVFTSVMTLSSLPIWSEWFEDNFSPHYSGEGSALSDKKIDLLDRLNLIKTILVGYVVIVGLIARVSHFFCLPFISLIGAPVWLWVYYRAKRDQEEQQKKANDKMGDAAGEESAKKRLNDIHSPVLASQLDLSSRRSQRLNQVADEHNVGIPEELGGRESMVPINQEGDHSQRIDEMDAIEQLRSQSVDLRANPAGMRRVLFKLKTTFSEARKKQLEGQSREEGKAPLPLSDECSVCLVNFSDYDFVVPLACNIDHLFHIECLLSWAEHNYTCPICRQPVIKSQSEIQTYDLMHQRNQLNQHEDQLGSGVLQVAAQGIDTEAVVVDVIETV